MLCENCNENNASVRYTQIINGEKTEMMLCEKCSHELGLDNINLSMPINFSSFFGGLLDSEEYNTKDVIPFFKTTKELKCNNCNMKYDEFINIGEFGCGECYEVFSPKIDTLLKRLHGDNTHVGRKSMNNTFKPADLESADVHKEKESLESYNYINLKEKLQKLQNDLKKAIADERYEDAAKIRDEIIKMKDIH